MNVRTPRLLISALAGFVVVAAVGQATAQWTTPSTRGYDATRVYFGEESTGNNTSVFYGNANTTVADPPPADLPPSTAAADFGSCDSCGTGDCCPPPLWEHRTSFWVEYIYLHVTGVDMAHAQQQNGTGGAGTVPFGRIGTADHEYEPGYRVGFSYALDPCQSVMFNYTRFRSSALDSVLPPVIGGGGGTVGSLVHHPGPAVIGSAGPVDAFYDVDFDTIDIDYRRLVNGDDRGWWNYTLGVRYGRLEQNFLQTGTFAGGAGGAISTTTDIDFDGLGVRIGLDGERRVGCGGWSVYGKTNLAAIVGEFRSDYTQVNTTGGVTQAIASWEDDRFVPIYEYELGIAWTGPCNHWRFTAGYYAAFWFNAVTTPQFVRAVQNSNYVDLGDTISFDGLTLRTEYRW